MAIDRDQVRAEELSQMIDALNNGSTTQSNDRELQELAELASMVKLAAGQIVPSPKVIDDIVGQFTKDVKDGPRKRFTRWLYSGAAGAVAAVLVVAAMNLVPVTPESGITMVTPDITISEVLPQSEVEQPPSPSGLMKQDAIVKQQTAAVPEAAVQQKTSKSVDVSGGKQTDAAPMSAVSAKKAKLSTGPILSLPGRNPKTRLVDSERGVITQVYTMADNKEVTITQKAKAGNEEKNDSPVYSIMATKGNITEPGKEKASKEQASKVMKDATNKVSRAIDNVEVTVEGEMPKEELKEIADSLVKDGE